MMVTRRLHRLRATEQKVVRCWRGQPRRRHPRWSPAVRPAACRHAPTPAPASAAAPPQIAAGRVCCMPTHIYVLPPFVVVMCNISVPPMLEPLTG